MTESGLRIALDLTELGARLVKQRYLRDHPSASEQEIKRAVIDWMSDRRQAPSGDSVGRPRTLN